MSLREAVARGPYDVIVLIGGANGWVGLAESEEVGNLLREQERCDRMIAAICTSKYFYLLSINQRSKFFILIVFFVYLFIIANVLAPIAMKKHGVFYGKKLTSYPTVEQRVSEGGKYIYMKDDVVVDGNLITSRGNFTSFHFALKIVEMLTNKANARETGTEMIVVY